MQTQPSLSRTAKFKRRAFEPLRSNQNQEQLSPAQQPSKVLLKVCDLRTSFFTEEGEIRAVDGVSFEVGQGKMMCIVGGHIWFEGTDLLTLSEREMRRLRGAKIAMVFQEPMTSLNPVFTVGSQIAEAIRLHQRVSRKEAFERAIEMLRLVKIADPERRVKDYPHQLSGGMRQRVMIAMALSCNPSLLIADEPTTALDVTIQAQILDLISELKEQLGLSVILVTHDLGIVAEYADDVTILYAARVMESAPAAELFRRPLNPYTLALLDSIPGLKTPVGGRLRAIPGTVPSLLNPPPGCRFHPRCPIAIDRCAQVTPALEAKAPNHYVACIRV